MARHYELLASKRKMNEDAKLSKVFLDEEINKIDKEIKDLKKQVYYNSFKTHFIL